MITFQKTKSGDKSQSMHHHGCYFSVIFECQKVCMIEAMHCVLCFDVMCWDDLFSFFGGFRENLSDDDVLCVTTLMSCVPYCAAFCTYVPYRRCCS